MYRTGGFGGKGFKFDEAERDMDNERKKLQKISHGMGESDDEDDQIVSLSLALSLINVSFTSPESEQFNTSGFALVLKALTAKQFEIERQEYRRKVRSEHQFAKTEKNQFFL